jgi:hypothetical protein
MIDNEKIDKIILNLLWVLEKEDLYIGSSAMAFLVIKSCQHRGKSEEDFIEIMRNAWKYYEETQE